MAGSNEGAVQNRIRLALSRGATRLFRNNTGALKDQNGRLVHFGLCKGSSDLIGWKSVVVTPEMVGQTVAIFCALEIKDKGKATVLQKHFISVVRDAGGVSGVARSVEEAQQIIGM
jgi:hypothetical protein